MSSPEVERFEVTEEDYENEFNPNRRRGRMSKKKAMLGIWADDDSDEERPAFGKSRSKGDFSAPVSFISGGLKQSSKIKKEVDDSNSEGSGEENVPIVQDPLNTRPFATKENVIKPARKTRSFAAGLGRDLGIGSWEKHTKGIGMKLLQKMGFEAGQGLGRNNQGITTPVEAVLRKGRAAVGAYGTERSERSLKDYPTYDSEEEEDKKFQQELGQWKRQGESKKKKPKYKYLTAQELIESGGLSSKVNKPLDAKAAKVKVIDMTGKEQRVLSGYHALSHRHDKPDEEEPLTTPVTRRAFDVPELTHNLNLLVDMAEEDILQNDRRLRYEKDHIVNMKYEKERLDTVCDQEEKQLSRLQKVLDVVKMCEERTKPDCLDPLTLKQCADVFRNLQDEFYEEYKMYDLSTLAVALVFPLMKTYFANWDPLKAPNYGVDTVEEWKSLLENYDTRHLSAANMTNMDVYQKLLWEIWLPKVRTAALKWNVRECDPFIELLENWLPLLPTWMMENIKDQLVIPRLLQEVENWNPLIDTMPIHAWLHPWLPLMAEKLEPLYGPIRHKLANALTNWHPSDTSAKVILQPWVSVFKPGHTEAFLLKNILPKLGSCIQHELQINPHHQNLEPWNWVMSWKGLIGTHHLGGMLEKTFFPRWTQVLCSWLSNMPNYDEVTNWYKGWKDLFSDDLLNLPQIKEQFNKALDIMNRAVTGHLQPGVRENMAYFTHTQRRQIGDTPTSIAPPPPIPGLSQPAGFGVRPSLPPGPNPALSFKDLIQKKAEESNLLFMPIMGKSQEARQVYRFGPLMMYMDRSVIFVYENGQWKPESLQSLVDKAKSFK